MGGWSLFRQSNRHFRPIPTPTRPIANVAFATFPLKGREFGRAQPPRHNAAEVQGLSSASGSGERKGEAATGWPLSSR